MVDKVIRDPIHGNIGFDGVSIELLDTAEMQRLRHIKQNGLCYLVYPAMNSTRFEHSLGVYHLGGLLAKHLNLSESDEMELKAACLLHDVGHGPFSHTFDDLMSKHGLDHEERSAGIVFRSGVSDILSSHGIKPGAVVKLIRGEGKLGKLLSSEVDVDKMDYLVRDAYYAGVAYGVTDVERLIHSIGFERGEIVVESGGLEAAESLLINRNMMYQTVYRHHTKRIAESMVVHAMDALVDGGASLKDISLMDDIELVHLMRSTPGYVKDIMTRIDCRRLFKTVFSERIGLLSEDSRTQLSDETHAIESRIALNLGVEKGYLLLDYPEASMSEYRVKIKTTHGLKSISEVSPLAKSLEASEMEKLTINIYVRKEDKGRLDGFRPEDYFMYEQKRISGYL
ncbi:MAG: HD domain-containing protein [Candidatus Altiarchaeota archaeon]